MNTYRGHSSNSLLKNSVILWSTFAVLAGGFVYVLFRPSEPLFFNWLKELGLENWLAETRDKSLPIAHMLPPWLVYSLPNGLWAFAYTMIVLGIWEGSSSYLKFLWYASIPVLVFGFELLQLSGGLPGTCCPFDILWGALGITLGYLTLFTPIRYTNAKISPI
jgi:hypothetical protein